MQRVLIVEKQLLLGAVVQGLLSKVADLEVVGVSPSDQASLVQEIERLQPNIVILGDPSHLCEPAHLPAHLRGYPKLRVVVVSANDNQVRIYGKQQVLITRVVDLVHSIRSG